MTHQATAPNTAGDRPILGISMILVAMACISVNDMQIKLLSDDYPLHQMVFVRSAIGIGFSLVMVQFEGGWRILKTATPFLHLFRCLAIVFANMAFFAALAVLPLANATALFFVAPLMITLLSIPFLGEKVGPRRLGAVVVGFIGVLVMLDPDTVEGVDNVGVLFLPVLAALGYATMQVMTRKLGISTRASAMAVYVQVMFIVVGGIFWLVAGDGRFVDDQSGASAQFLLRAWRWPEPEDQLLFVALGLNSAIVAYALSQAYRVAKAATVAPYEYVALPLSIMWGWLVWHELPRAMVFLGIALIMGAGIYVFIREGVRKKPVAAKPPLRRW